MRCQRHASAALIPGKITGTRCTGDWVGLGPRGLSGRVRKNSTPLRFDFLTVYLIAIVVIVTLLSEEV